MDDEDEQDVYLVEKIVDRRVRRGRVEYRVRWQGFPPDQDSWEPFTSLKESCLPLIQKFHNRYRKMLQNKRRFSIPVSAAQRLRLDRDTSDAHEVSSSETDSKLKEDDALADRSSVSSTRSQVPSRASKRNFEEKILVALSGRPTSLSKMSNVTYTGSISVNPSCLITSDSMDKTIHFTSGSVSPITKRVDSPATRGSIDSAGSTVSNSTTSSNKVRRSPQTSSTVKRPHSGGKAASCAKPNGTSPASAKTKSESQSITNKSSQIVISRSAKSSPQPKSDKSSTQPNKPTSSRVREETIVENGVSETGRKSVTIMLKTSPTHEFHSTKALQTQQSSPVSTVSTPSRAPVVTKLPDSTISHGKQPQQSPATAVVSSPVHQTTPVLPTDTVVTKVMGIVHQLKSLRRRPVQNLIVSWCQRHHGLTQNEVLAALDSLVSQGQLHEISFTDGISYRFNPGVVARGDLVRPTTLSAKIKAKYASKIKNKKTHAHVPEVLPGSKRAVSTTEFHHASAKRNKPNTATVNFPFLGQNPWSTPASQSWPAYQSTFGRLLKPTGARTFGFRQFPRDNFPTNQIADGIAADRSTANVFLSAKPSCNSNGGLASTLESSLSSPPSVQPPGSRIFVVPPASPIRDTNVEIRFNSLPHKRLSQTPLSTDVTAQPVDRSNVNAEDNNIPTHIVSAPNPDATGSVPFTEVQANNATASRRSSTRQTEATYKFRSILVKKNTDGGFTEVWLQSPGSLLKNAFTVQVLEELTTALNQAVYDTTRLVMICGMGTVFSAGLDLAALTGPLPSRSSISATPFFDRDSSFVHARNVVTSGNTSTHCCCCPAQSSGICTQLAHSHSSSNMNNPSGFHGLVDPSICQRLGSALRAFLLALVAFPKPVVVGVNGPAMGLAVAILPLCDLIYVSDAATLQIPYTQLCQTPEGGASFTLASLVGLPLANELLLTGRKLSAREALQRGLASDLLYPKCFKEELLMRCRKLACSSPMALEMTKCIIRMQHRERIEFVINTECRKLIELWQTPEFRHSAIEFLLRDMGDFL